MPDRSRSELFNSPASTSKGRRGDEFAVAPAGRRINADPRMRRKLQTMVKSLDKAFARFEKKRSHKLRNSLIVAAASPIYALIARA